ncbi:hypothetical protein B0A50_03492 [Salinomyces thailandicus]|uniref:TAFII28-like protein domain-containing protein n=1 Tax=Salinomyces thailandicus TaxID=706561 RepID=A0A4V5N4W7_9PEZI|nr:hypothetical protein B0A50_03492 [Salinomyces thailandica]
MASPPSYGGATSPPPTTGLALPRQRPTLALPGQVPSRKPSLAPPSATAATPSAHPLRQTSFPPTDSLEAQHALAQGNNAFSRQYSPSAADSDAGGAGLEGFSDDDNDINSAISGPAGEPSSGVFDGAAGGKKRKRGTGRGRGRPPKGTGPRAGSASLVNGEEGGAGRGAKSTAGDDGDADAAASDDDEDEDDAGGRGGRAPLYEGGQMSADQLAEERERKRLFYEGITEEQRSRLAAFQRSKLRTADVRKLVNQVLGQSVPQNVVLVVGAYAKMFAGMLIEEAREVQGEWEAAEPKRADGQDNRAYKRLRRSKQARAAAVEDKTQASPPETKKGGEQTNGSQTDGAPAAESVKQEPTSPSNDHSLSNNVSEPDAELAELPSGGAAGLERDLEECDRGPLLPEHLREALRRYKKRRAGGSVGFTGLGLEGRENTAPRMGGRRLFR